ncbi:unnamed protein product [Zymoseptoria tritici ST99CH_1A5]|uniref:Uncharacterized protein n=2 Tax=Zymoseptoria tritici TaxID=1047171 RepID=A0A2H1GPS5_ZYMTR|nr:unnamed protein product [Zymoseptoria tritici ST99CH_1E4]SMR57944.1 unnamed protein product [Zymoseptoria tritici ST99CH_3D1]SMY26377.1 unnamed protein product [Zymoseptoria tritici ST99CH_1A5]
MSGLNKSAKTIELEKFLRKGSLEPKPENPRKSWIEEQSKLAAEQKPGPWGFNNEFPQAQADIQEQGRKQDAAGQQSQAERFGVAKPKKKVSKFIVGGMNGSDSEEGH